MGNSFSESGRNKALGNWANEDGESVMRKVAIAKLFPDDYNELSLLRMPVMCRSWDLRLRENSYDCGIEGGSDWCKLIRKRIVQCEAIDEEVEKMTDPVTRAERAYEKLKEHDTEDGETALRKVAIAKLFPDHYLELSGDLKRPSFCRAVESVFRRRAKFCATEREDNWCKTHRRRMVQCEDINKEIDKMTKGVID